MKVTQYLKRCLAIALLAAVYSCNNSDSKKHVGTALDSSPEAAKVDTTKYNSEYLLYSSVKINGILPIESKFADFVKVVGKPDSLINFNPDMECQSFEQPYQNIHFQGGMFFLVKEKAIFQNIDFRKRPDLELKTSAITLNAKTTLSDVQALFPNAVRKIRTVEAPDLAHLRLVDLGASKEFADEWWILCFNGDKLVSVELYSPC
jgi:hypothetical protein